MTPIDFKHSNFTWKGYERKGEDPVMDLPAYKDERQTISCWRLTFWERLKVLLLGRVWLFVLSGSAPCQPTGLSADYPFSDGSSWRVK